MDMGRGLHENTDGRSAYELNGAEVDSLVAVVGDHYDRPAVWASNLLCAVYGQCRAPYTGEAGVPKSGRSRQRDITVPNLAYGSYGLQPNPARQWVLFSYDRGDEGAAPGRIVVRDLLGRTMATLPMNGIQGQQVWDTQGVVPGTYLVEYRSGEQRLHMEKLIIQQ